MELTPAEFNEIRKAVHDLCGIVIADEKEYLVKSRLEPVLEAHGLTSYGMLALRLKQPNSLLQDQVIDAITTNETSFNRDGHPFVELRRSILPEMALRLIERKATSGSPYAKARIWCAAAATGQEAYSVAMAISDFLAARPAGELSIDDFFILATDISSAALAMARDGRYSTTEIDRGVTAEQRNRYFRQAGGTWVFNPPLRRILEFLRLNIVEPLPNLGTFDLILCRNLLIYLDDATRRRLCQALHAALNPRGILMIGAAESLYGLMDAFSTEYRGNTVIYRKQ